MKQEGHQECGGHDGVNIIECNHSAYDAKMKLLRIKLTKHLTKVKIKAAVSSSMGWS